MKFARLLRVAPRSHWLRRDSTPSSERLRNADSQRLITFAIASGFLLIRNFKADIWPLLFQANKRRKNTILIRKDSVCIAGVNLLDKRLPEIVTCAGFGFDEIFWIAEHRADWRMGHFPLKYILYAANIFALIKTANILSIPEQITPWNRSKGNRRTG